MQIGPYTCVVTSNDRTLGEYETQVDEDGGEAICWVPSNEGHSFRIECGFGGTLSDTEAMRMVLSADGEILDTRIAVDTDQTTMNGIRLDSWSIMPYLFKPQVKPTEDYDEEDMNAEDAKDPKWKKRGVITLEMTQVEAVGFDPIDDDDPSSTMPTEERLRTILVGEKDISPKKAARRSVSWAWGRNGSEPCATFHFKHRPKEWLEGYGFMPRDITHTIDFDAFNLNGQPEYLTHMKHMTLQDQVMS